MKIADLIKKDNQKVLVRVPASLQEKLGVTEIQGKIQGFKKKNYSTRVVVKIARKGEFDFRPQDIVALA